MLIQYHVGIEEFLWLGGGVGEKWGRDELGVLEVSVKEESAIVDREGGGKEFGILHEVLGLGSLRRAFAL